MKTKRIEKIDLSRYMGYVRTNIAMDENNTLQVLLQRLENKMNEIIAKLNGEGRP